VRLTLNGFGNFAPTGAMRCSKYDHLIQAAQER
jgi:hypothetical protein